ncbi:SusD family protein [compost metagenome]
MGLIGLYEQNDLRKQIFFRPNTGQNLGTFSFRGSFNGNEQPFGVFTGTTTAEILLIRAECYARGGNKSEAISDLNTLLEKRYNKLGWLPLNPSLINNPLEVILTERRKELVFRGIRWQDLRRLNAEGANITIKRTLDGTDYLLPANDKRWVALIPFDVINRSGIQQNIR